jgi:cytochrome c-type biogenesis protein CcmH
VNRSTSALFALALALVARTTWAGPAEDAEARAQRLGGVLRCPVCQGMPISDSPSDMAQSMMKRVRELTAEGRSDQEILAYFTQRYGEWVLLEPTTGGLNLLLWTLPAVALLAGLWFVRRYARGATSTGPAASAARSTPVGGGSPYLDAVRREVDE